MATLNEYFENAILSEASYAYLDVGMNDADYKLALDKSGMKSYQAR